MSSTPAAAAGIRIAADRGGTFTDVYCWIPAELFPASPLPKFLGTAVVLPRKSATEPVQLVIKLLSEDPSYEGLDAPSEAIRRVLQIVTGNAVPRGPRMETSLIESVRMASTVATNALLERKGSPFGLVLTAGFADLLEIGDQTRPDLFDLAIANKAKVLYSPADVVQAKERVTMEGWTLNPAAPSVDQILADGQADTTEAGEVRLGLSGEAVRILEPLDTEHIRQQLEGLYTQGLRSLAVCLLHSWTFPDHERAIGEIAKEVGFQQISLSSDLAPSIRAVPRGNAVTVDAYLSPVLRSYVDAFQSHFVDGKAGRSQEFMKSDGGLVSADRFTGLRAVLSGPAGGVVGCALTAYSAKRSKPVVGFDMGGTSTDVSRFSGSFDLVYEALTAGIKVACPQLAIETVAAGGGSKLFYKNRTFVVGPESVGAHPGPACYRKGGELAITDANAVLGRLIPAQFANIFGPNADQPLDVDASVAKFRVLTDEINASRGASAQPYTVDEVAAGFVKVANEEMSRPMRSLTAQKGYATSSHDLCAFGGAAGQHAAAIAGALGIETVIIPRFSSILSAYGVACADLASERSIPYAATLVDDDFSSTAASGATFAAIEGRVATLKADVAAELRAQDVADDAIEFSCTVSCSFSGSDTVIHVPWTRALRGDFIAAHLRETSFTMERPVVVSGVKVRGVGRSLDIAPPDFADELAAADEAALSGAAASVTPGATTSAYFEYADGVGRRIDTPVFRLGDVPSGSSIPGPAIIVDSTQTLVVEAYSRALVLDQHVVLQVQPTKTVSKQQEQDEELSVDPIEISVFGNRFMGIAEEMGNTLQRTSISVSIKERLDFSCSIHSTDGGLVANAPHIPVHLGSMAFAVQGQHNHHLGTLRPGDVLLTNHPQWGGTHLPDLTTVTPVFDPADDTKVLFYVASRGHHSDIGGTSMTGMNPVARELWHEGVSVKTFKLVSEGKFDEEGVRELFAQPAKYPGGSATRNIGHNITDLKAAVSANVRGINLVKALFAEFGARKVMFYMEQIQILAAETVRKFFRETAIKTGGNPLRARDFMDDGTEIVVEIRINAEEGTAVMDWTGTGEQMHGNFNSPISLTYAAAIYALRCMIPPDIPIPLNQGVLDPVEIIVPEGCFLNPRGVVAISGSTISSQRLVDVILRAFNAAAASQGCASSLGFGIGGKDPVTGEVRPGFSYGEAIGGGSGAGPTWHGVSGVAVHSTNTRLTDIEVLEARTPLLVKEFKLRKGSGGKGEFNGGDGIIRRIQARTPLTCSIVSQRRVFAPFGLEGGESAKRGKNIWCRVLDDQPEGGKAWEEINMGNNGLVVMRKGDHIRIETPGGGGWGTPLA